jgi:hypothetical protein
MAVVWFTGQSGAGKTTAARAYQAEHGGILLDGDAMRTVWPGLGWSQSDRWEQNTRLARLARLLEEQGQDVVVASICPYRMLRVGLGHLARIEWVYVPGGRPVDAAHPYEPPLPGDEYRALPLREPMLAGGSEGVA